MQSTYDLSYKRILKLAIPVTIAQLLIFSCSMIDLIFIKDFGHEVIATLGITNTIYNTIISFAEGLVAGTAVVMAKHVTQGNIHSCGHVVCIGILLALFLGLCFYIFEPWLGRLIFSTVNHGELLQYGPEYLSFWIKSLLAVFLLFVCEGVFRGALTGFDDTKFIAYIGLTTSYLLFLPLSYVLSIYLEFGIIGNYCAFLLWTISDVILFAYRCYRNGLFKLPNLVQHKELNQC